MRRRMTTTEKIITWARAYKFRNLGHVLSELNITEASLMSKLNKMQKNGKIKYEKFGRNIALSIK